MVAIKQLVISGFLFMIAQFLFNQVGSIPPTTIMDAAFLVASAAVYLITMYALRMGWIEIAKAKWK